jgi:hypothetical protein
VVVRPAGHEQPEALREAPIPRHIGGVVVGVEHFDRRHAGVDHRGNELVPLQFAGVRDRRESARLPEARDDLGRRRTDPLDERRRVTGSD